MATGQSRLKNELDSTPSESSHSFTVVKYWAAQFKRRRVNCRDEHRSGQQNEVMIPEMVTKIHKAVLDERRL